MRHHWILSTLHKLLSKMVNFSAKNQYKIFKIFQEREDEPVDDSAVVDDMFGFLPNYQNEDTISESQAPSAFRDLPAPKVVQNGDIIPGILFIDFGSACIFTKK